MKSVKEIINQKPVFLGDFKNEIEVFKEFSEKYCYDDEINEVELIKEYNGSNVLFASYDTGCYDGEAFVILEKNGKLYEVNGSHCSCYGLEGQWEPEELNLKTLEHIIINGTKFNYLNDESLKYKLIDFLGIKL